MEEQINNQTFKQKKFGIELKQSAKKDWYIGSIRITADTKEELEQSLKEAIEIAKRKIKEAEEDVGQSAERARKVRFV